VVVCRVYYQFVTSSSISQDLKRLPSVVSTFPLRAVTFFSIQINICLFVAKEDFLEIYRLTVLQAENYGIFHKPFRTVLGCLKDIPRVLHCLHYPLEDEHKLTVNSGLDLEMNSFIILHTI